MPRKTEPLGVTKSGTTITDELADKLADEAERGYDLSKARQVGRPSLEHGRSPRISIRVTQRLHDRALARARREGKTLSELAREALERHVR